MRFFVIKSLTYENLVVSVRKGLWATHRNHERILNEAYLHNDRVVFFFSVNESGHWQGMAVMTSPIHPTMQAPDPALAPQWSAEFSVEWLRLVNMPFSASRSLRNPLNDNWPVSRSRDCQELTPELGKQMVYLVYAAPEVSLNQPQLGGAADNSKPLDHHSILDMPYGAFNSPAGGGPSASPNNPQRLVLGGGASSSPPIHERRAGAAGKRLGQAHFPLLPGPGFMFGCNQHTMEECMSRSLFGLPINMDEPARRVVHPGTTLFLFNMSDKSILGVFEATSPIGHNLEPDAWARGDDGLAGGYGGMESPFPVQVRVRPILEAPPVSESDPEVKAILGGGRNKNRIGPLSQQQCQDLADLMAQRAGVDPSSLGQLRMIQDSIAPATSSPNLGPVGQGRHHPRGVGAPVPPPPGLSLPPSNWRPL